MAFADTAIRAVMQGDNPVKVTLEDACEVGDLLAYGPVGMVLADASDGALPAALVAGEKGVAGEIITAYHAAVIKGPTGMIPGNSIYLSDTAGDYAGSAGSTTQVVGKANSATELFVCPFPGKGTKIALIAGGAAGDHTVTGIAVGDELIFVAHISTAAAIATMADLTSEFTISAANTINNAAGTETASDQLLVFYNDLT